MDKLSLPIPRAIYYMHPFTPVRSLFSILNLKSQTQEITQFEESFSHSVDCRFGVVTSHARIAFYAILKSLDLPANSEVLMTAINLPDMVNMITLNHHRPVCVDYDKQSYDISIADLQRKLTSKTKVLFLTVLAGILPNLNEIHEFTKKNNLILIQDLTQAYRLLYQGKDIAAAADFSIYSLCDLKDIHTHRGGIVVSNSESSAATLRKVIREISTVPEKSYFLKFILEDFISSMILRRIFFSIFIYPLLKLIHFFDQSQNLTNLTKGKGFKIFSINAGRGLWGGDGDLIRRSIPSELRYKFTSHQARLGLIRLQKAQSIIHQRQRNARRLIEKINTTLLPFNTNSEHTFWKFPIFVSDLKTWQKELFKFGIDSAPTNLPLLSKIECFRSVLTDDLQNADRLTENVLYIPIHYYLNFSEIDFIADKINVVFQKLGS